MREIESRGGVTLLDDQAANVQVKVTNNPRELADVDAVLVAVKTYATEDALRPLDGVLAATVPLVSLQNGILARDQIAAVLGSQHPIALAPTTEAVTSEGPGLARHAGRGATLIGWAAASAGSDAVLTALVESLRRAGLAAGVTSPIEPHVWGKLIVNAAVNPVTALAGVANGVLLSDPALHNRAMTLAREAVAVAAAAGIRLPFGNAEAEVERVARTTGANRSSMLQDLERGRTTEIDALNGEIVRRGHVFGVAAPENARICDEVRARMKA